MAITPAPIVRPVLQPVALVEHNPPTGKAMVTPTITTAPSVRNVARAMALEQHNMPTGETLVTPELMEKVNKATTGVIRKAIQCAKKRQQSVAADAADNGMSALSAALHLDIAAAMKTATGPTVSKRPKKAKVSAPKAPLPEAVQPDPPTSKCQGCIHCDLLELKVMEPKDIRYYLKQDRLLNLATCAGECKARIHAIHLAAPKDKLFYCDETLKGFYAPENDAIKKGLECNLILCAPCRALRFLKYAPAPSTDGAVNRRTSRRGTNN